MILIHESSNLTVERGDSVVDFRGVAGTVMGWAEPHTVASTGRIYVDEGSSFPSVYGCKWIDREDRAAAPAMRVVSVGAPTT